MSTMSFPAQTEDVAQPPKRTRGRPRGPRTTTQEKHDFIVKNWDKLSPVELAMKVGYRLSTLYATVSLLRKKGIDLPRRKGGRQTPPATHETEGTDEPYVTPFENGLGVKCVDEQRNAYAIIRVNDDGSWMPVGHFYAKHEFAQEVEEIVRKLPRHIFV